MREELTLLDMIQKCVRGEYNYKKRSSDTHETCINNQDAFDSKFHDDLIDMLTNEYVCYPTVNLTDEVLEKIYIKAYTLGHADGYYAVLIHAKELTEFVISILDSINS